MLAYMMLYVEHEDFLEVAGPGWRPARDHWLDKGCQWNPGDGKDYINCLVRWERRTKPPHKPRGLEGCDAATRAR